MHGSILLLSDYYPSMHVDIMHAGAMVHVGHDSYGLVDDS